jgi:hypothetical protein
VKLPRLLMLVFCYFAAGMALVGCVASGEKSLCDNVDEPCLEIQFDGTNCEFEVPAELRAGTYNVIFANYSDGDAQAELARPLNGKTLEDVAADTLRRPTGHAPSWVQLVGLWGSSMTISGGSQTFRRPLQAGDYAVMCFRIDPHYAIYGGGFTLQE